MNKFNIRFFLLSILGLLFQNVGAQTISTFEYWFNSAFSSRQQIIASGEDLANITEVIESSSLDDGLHLINMRAKDSKGKWSIVHSQSFYKNKSLLSDGGIVAYEYWFDNDHTNKQYQSVATAKDFILINGIDLAGIESGLHTFNIRSLDNLGRWSIVHTQTFFKNKVLPTDGGVVAYEYWIDNDHDKKVTKTHVATNSFVLIDGIDLSDIESGLHTFNIRSLDNLNSWSIVHTQTFFKNKVLPTDGGVVAYEYWIDNDFDKKIIQATTTSKNFILVDGADMSSVESGLHTFNIRSLDNLGRWSIVHTQTFYKNTLVPEGENKIDAYCYWFDKNQHHSEMVLFETEVNPFGLNVALNVPDSLEMGDHLFNIRFRDNSGRWSIAEVDTFTKVQAAPRINIEGIVRRSDNNMPVNSGKVYLYDIADFGMYDVIDVVDISETGSYSFLRRQSGSYLIKAVSDDIQSSLPTYFGNSGLWTGAVSVEANDEGTITKDINLTILPALSGQAIIKGVINSENAELADKAVIVLTKNSAPVSVTYANSAGEYIFGNIPIGDYQVVIDIAGVSMLETYEISITEDSQVKDNINYDVKNDGIKKTPITGLSEQSTGKLIVYPNPFENHLILIPDDIRGEFSARLVDMSGKTVWMENIYIQSGEVEMTIPTLPRGVYLLRLTGEHKQFQMKVQKK